MLMNRLALLVVMLAAAGCVDETSSRIAAVEGSCDTWTVDDPITLWPPDHTMIQFTLDDCVTITPTDCPPPPTGYCGDGVQDPGEECDDGNDNPFDGCDICRVVDITPDRSLPGQSSATGLSITTITSSESPDGTGDGQTIDDVVIVDATTFQLRAERGGIGTGRTYQVNFVDANGANGTCTFVVPHDLAAQ